MVTYGIVYGEENFWINKSTYSSCVLFIRLISCCFVHIFLLSLLWGMNMFFVLYKNFFHRFGFWKLFLARWVHCFCFIEKTRTTRNFRVVRVGNSVIWKSRITFNHLQLCKWCWPKLKKIKIKNQNKKESYIIPLLWYNATTSPRRIPVVIVPFYSLPWYNQEKIGPFITKCYSSPLFLAMI